MSVYDYKSLLEHVGHKIVIVTYGRSINDSVNVAIECEDCNEVLLDYNKPDDNRPGT